MGVIFRVTYNDGAVDNLIESLGFIIANIVVDNASTAYLTDPSFISLPGRNVVLINQQPYSITSGNPYRLVRNVTVTGNVVSWSYGEICPMRPTITVIRAR